MKALPRLFALFVLLFASPAMACSPVAGPAVLSSPGLYCLTSNIYQTVPGNHGITVTSAGVTLEGRGLSIIGPGYGTGSGIYVSPGATGFDARNLQATQFLIGVNIEGANARVRDIDASYNHFRGFKVNASGAWILYSRAANISGYSGYTDSFAMGIEVVGANCVIAFNQIGTALPIGIGEAIGISLSYNNSGCSVYNNTIHQQSDPQHGATFGVWAGYTDASNSIHNNIVIGHYYAISASATTPLFGNTVLPKCANYFYWNPTNYGTQNTEVVPPGFECPDTIERLTTKTQQEPNVAQWWYRLGWATRTRTCENAAAKSHYQQACTMGISSACYYANQAVIVGPHC